jgi:aspartate/tyrosine/aromatic aminotransferase
LKVNLGRGVYKDDNGKSWVLPCVREVCAIFNDSYSSKAEKIILSSNPDNEYLPFKGLASFAKLSAEFAFGNESPQLKEGKVFLLFIAFS